MELAEPDLEVVWEASAVLVERELEEVAQELAPVASAVLVVPVSGRAESLRAELEFVVGLEFVPVQPSLAVRHWVLMVPPSARTAATSGTSILD